MGAAAAARVGDAPKAGEEAPCPYPRACVGTGDPSDSCRGSIVILSLPTVLVLVVAAGADDDDAWDVAAAAAAVARHPASTWTPGHSHSLSRGGGGGRWAVGGGASARELPSEEAKGRPRG